MSTAVIIDLADAVVFELNVPDRFGAPLTLAAERGYVPVHELKDLATLKVTVVPRTEADGRLSRRTWQQDYLVDVGWQKRTNRSAEQVDPLVLLVERAKVFFQDTTTPRPLSTAPDFELLAVEVMPVFDPEHMDAEGVFTSVLTLTFRLMR